MNETRIPKMQIYLKQTKTVKFKQQTKIVKSKQKIPAKVQIKRKIHANKNKCL